MSVNFDKYIKPNHVKIQKPLFIFPFFLTTESTGKHRGNGRQETSVPGSSSVPLCVLCGFFFSFPP